MAYCKIMMQVAISVLLVKLLYLISIHTCQFTAYVENITNNGPKIKETLSNNQTTIDTVLFGNDKATIAN
jgi:hypothetical protein